MRRAETPVPTVRRGARILFRMNANPFDTTLLPAAGSTRDAAAVPVIAGYDSLVLVGRGGMGKVYRARHTTLGRTVALKVLAHEPDERMLARFAEEARAVARLQHPNICPLFETGTVEGRPWFAQEFLSGGSLAQQFGGVPQDPRAAAGLVETIAGAVQHSHESGILHRDLKPGNILLGADGTPKVTDYGLAKVLAAPGTDSTEGAAGGLTRTGEIVGTPGYMPPEQASGIVTGLGPATDVYGLGAILYEALTGRPPFQAPDALQTLLMVLAMDPVSPRLLQPKVPRDLETVCLKCLEKSPKRRYPSARELADDLGRFREGRPILARPVGFFERTAKWAQRRKAAAAMAALSGLLIVLVIAFAILQTVNASAVRQSNSELAAAKTKLEDSNAELESSKRTLESTNVNLRATKAESDRSYALAVETLQSILERYSNRFFGIPLAEQVMLAMRDEADALYRKLTELRPDDRELAVRYLSNLAMKANLERRYLKPDDAVKTLDRAEILLRTLLGRTPGDRGLLLVQVNLGKVRLGVLADGPEQEVARRKSLGDIARFCELFPADPETAPLQVDRYTAEAQIARDRGDLRAQLENQAKATAAARAHLRANPLIPSAAILLDSALIALGQGHEDLGEFTEADAVYSELEKLLSAARVARPTEPQLKSQFADVRESRANVAVKLGDLREAGDLYREIEPLRRELAELFPLEPYQKYRLASNLAVQSRLLHRADPESAKKKLAEAVGICGKLAKEFPKDDVFVKQDGTWREWLRVLNEKK